MGGDGSAPGGCRQRNATCLTATPSAAGRLPPPLRSVSSYLLDLYHEGVDNGGWARVLYNARGGMEKFLFIRKTEPTPAPTVPAPPHKHGRPASDTRRARDKQRREAWAARRRNHSQPRLHSQAKEDNIIARPASAGTVITYIATSTPIFTSPSRHSTSAGINGIAAASSAVTSITIASIDTTDCFATASSSIEKTGKDLQQSDSRQ